ncbi:nucleoside 2-deoxyribosyltransferase [Isosphaera pallida ATCC 43644]|jgi:nucleoside 2-deoxyribosyltransferase|uniref:Nucleoside 2-deoxyribosyltransferase n=1 Tax=Isosphaera pallida (strain ATCC 43644 / DSM 9630 / IS1B) TaxID=575540 RepID=E8R6B7_ISOPI|nr:nucleoside 2-deoxyribosyltransferase [Isosphaera pallida]ADV61818.1 nucleoside 2-deoxyribosyltransferase [Isosphaera pallida ATCC 43644]
MRLYFAGPLFTQAERLWNHTIVQGLRLAGHEVFLPQEAIAELESLEAATIFELDLDGVRAAEALVAVLDGADPDSGTCFECGVAYALGRPIVAVRTDFRAGGDALPGQKMPTINLMLSQAVTEAIELVGPRTNPEAVVAAVLAALDRVGQRLTNQSKSNFNH